MAGSVTWMAQPADRAARTMLGTSVAWASASAIWWAVSGRGMWCEKSRLSRSLPGTVPDESP